MTKESTDVSVVPVAVRVYPDLKPSQPERKAPQIDGMLVFDCECRTSSAQNITFGSYRFLVEERCLEEGLFYADDLKRDELAVLQAYAREHGADTDPRGVPERGIPTNPQLRLLSIADFRRLLHRVARRSLGLATEPLPFADRVALGQITVSSPEVLRPAHEAQLGQNLRAADQAVQLHPQLPRR